MNEPIKRLATLAGGEFYEGFLGSPNSIKFTEDELQKFAELIVRECAMEAIDEVALQGGSYSFIKSSADLAIEAAIRQRLYTHFGIEE